jgi:hypothetical protein
MESRCQDFTAVLFNPSTATNAVIPCADVAATTPPELTVNQRTPWGQHALMYVVFS